MPIVITCDECDKRFRVNDDKAGTRIRCPNCEATIRVSGGDEEDSPPRRQSRSGPVHTSRENFDNEPRRRRPRDDYDDDYEYHDDRDDDYDDRPRRSRRPRAKSGSNSKMLWILGGGGAALVAIIVVLVLVLGGGSDKPSDVEDNATTRKLDDYIKEAENVADELDDLSAFSPSSATSLGQSITKMAQVRMELSTQAMRGTLELNTPTKKYYFKKLSEVEEKVRAASSSSSNPAIRAMTMNLSQSIRLEISLMKRLVRP